MDGITSSSPKISLPRNLSIPEPNDSWRAGLLLDPTHPENGCVIEVLQIRAEYFTDKFLRKNPVFCQFISREDLIQDILVSIYSLVLKEGYKKKKDGTDRNMGKEFCPTRYHELTWTEFNKLVTTTVVNYLFNLKTRTPIVFIDHLPEDLEDDPIWLYPDSVRAYNTACGIAPITLNAEESIFIVEYFNQAMESYVFSNGGKSVTPEFSTIGEEFRWITFNVQKYTGIQDFPQLLDALGYQEDPKKKIQCKFNKALQPVGLDSNEVLYVYQRVL